MNTEEVAEYQESSGWFNWTKYSFSMLRTIEKSILSHLKTSYRGLFVDIGPCIGEADKIWTITLNTESKKTPILLLHGLGSGVALWVLNLDSFAAHRPVYAIDMLGFGRSSRPQFQSDPLVAEKQMVKSIEDWRKEMKLNDLIILGHSFGGYLACSYALSYPDRVKHLILADPWGFPEKPAERQDRPGVPLWARIVANAFKPLNPLWIIRFAGPFGGWLVEKTRPDIIRKFSSLLTNDTDIPQYIHQCNSQTPSGESVFHSMMQDFGWAKYPMINRIKEMKTTVPITFMYGSKSWVDNAPGDAIKSLRHQSYVNVQVIHGAGHHVYADHADVFNKYVNDACHLCDLKSDTPKFVDDDNDVKISND